MKHWVFATSLLISSVYAFDIDINTLEQITQNNPDAFKERLILAKYYKKQGNNLKALTLLNEVLEKEPKQKDALKLKKQIEKRQLVLSIFREAGLTTNVSTQEAQKKLKALYINNQYKAYTQLYEALNTNNIQLDDQFHIQAAYIYLWDGSYNKSKKALKHIHQNYNIDATKIKADICYYQGDYKCASDLYKKLYQISYNLEYALKLIQSYIYLGETTKAQRVYDYISRKHPKSQKVHNIGKKLNSSLQSYLENRKNAYEKNKSYETLEAYAIALNEYNKTDKAINIIHNFNKQTPSNKSLLLEAKYLTWQGKTNKALEILENSSLKSNLEAKYMIAQIYSWDKKYDKSNKYLNEVIKNTQDKELLFNAKKTKAFIAMWQGNTKNAKKLFKALKKENPNDKEINEALMELDKNYNALIKIYKKRLSSNSQPETLKRLAQMYQQTNKNSDAIKLYKKYLQKKPQDLETTKELALLLIEQKSYYDGFGYLEYYAAKKQSLESDLLLAKNYYWSGFSKEALDVLERTIKRYPESQEALKLKAKILKVAPRFTTSNSGETIRMYFDNVASKQLQIADSLYFNSHYKSSLDYYKSYLEKHPDDHEVRYRYAFALENAQEYGKAEGEFSLIFWTKDSDELRYHYAYNMMKNGKLKEAKELLTKLKTQTFHPLSHTIKQFLNSWRDAWQSQDFKKYASFYSEKYKNNEVWALKKQQIFSKAKYISVSFYDPVIKEIEPNRYIIRFYQEYATDKKSDKGYKTLHVKCEENQNECVITKELWKAQKYKKELLLTPYIDNALKEIKRLESAPLAYARPKKKTLYHT